MRLRNSLDLIVVAALAILAAAVVLASPASTYARVPATLPLVLLLPGYALGAGFLPLRSIGAAERLVLSLGLSLAIATLGGFLLNWIGPGMRPATWAILLAAATLLGALVAGIRRWAAPAAALPVPRVSFSQAGMLASAALLAFGAFAIAHASAASQAQGFTQLWILPSGSGGSAVTLGVASQELSPTTYTLRLEAGGRLIREWRSIALAPGEQWTASASLPQRPPNDQPVTAELYRENDTTVAYRHVLLRLGAYP